MATTLIVLHVMVLVMDVPYQLPTASTVLLVTTGRSDLMLVGAVQLVTMEITLLPSALSALLVAQPALLPLFVLPASRWLESLTTFIITNVLKYALRLPSEMHQDPLVQLALLHAKLVQDQQLHA